MANNIIKRVWNRNRMVNIESLQGMAFQAESGGHTFEIYGTNDAGATVPLSGTITGVFLRPDNTDVALTGSVVDGVARVTLTQACYAATGRFGLTIFTDGDGLKTCVYACVGTVSRTTSGTVAGSTPQDVVDLINAINTAVATIPASYTDLMASIAPTYSNTAVYAVGSYVWYNGNLYRCTTAITTAETWTAAHWQSATVDDGIAQNKAALDDISETTILYDDVDTSSIVRVSNSKIASNNNLEASTSYHSVLYMQVQAAGEYHVTSSSYSQYTARVYQNISSQSDIVAANYVKTFSNGVATLAAGQWIVTSAWDASYTITVKVVSGSQTDLKSTTPLSTTQKSEMKTAIDTVLNDVSADGYLYILDGWERGGYTAWNSKDSRTYRARLSSAISFPRDVYLIAKPNFYIGGFTSGGSIGDGKTIYKLSANTQLDLYVRRIAENTSETIDVATFAAQILVSTALAPIELYAPTFTDVSMFERVGVCGDSYAGGGGIISGITPLTWGKNLQRQAGITVDIYAQSGQTIVEWNANTTKGLPAVLAGTECGLYWMAHGINNTSIIGSASDMETTPRPNTFYGQYAYAIEQIQATFPKARIVLATVTGSDYALWETIYSGVNTAIRNIAAHFSIPCIDIADDDFYKSQFYTDGCRSNHPTAMLCAGMAMANRRLLAKCIMDNASYFVNYGSTT